MVEEIRRLKEELFSQIFDKIQLWDFMKMKMREFIIKLSKERARKRRLEIERLENEISELERRVISNSIRSIIDDIENKKSRIK